jgi:hypothetical protein
MTHGVERLSRRIDVLWTVRRVYKAEEVAIRVEASILDELRGALRPWVSVSYQLASAMPLIHLRVFEARFTRPLSMVLDVEVCPHSLRSWCLEKVKVRSQKLCCTCARVRSRELRRSGSAPSLIGPDNSWQHVKAVSSRELSRSAAVPSRFARQFLAACDAANFGNCRSAQPRLPHLKNLILSCDIFQHHASTSSRSTCPLSPLNIRNSAAD